VKFACHALGVPQVWVSYAAIAALLAALYANANDLVYFFVKVFFHSVLSIFFTSMEMLGMNNIPQHGPIIFTGNHMNQFVDGAMIMITNPHHISFLVAEKSYNERIVGDFAKAMGAIPVARPQDHARPGPGCVKFDGLVVRGEGTRFTQLAKVIDHLVDERNINRFLSGRKAASGKGGRLVSNQVRDLCCCFLF
jgi:glycerol-3-phosphate O-acyltransferase/dihydroxyacetone phosphate acyltransferase